MREQICSKSFLMSGASSENKEPPLPWDCSVSGDRGHSRVSREPYPCPLHFSSSSSGGTLSTHNPRSPNTALSMLRQERLRHTFEDEFTHFHSGRGYGVRENLDGTATPKRLERGLTSASRGRQQFPPLRGSCDGPSVRLLFLALLAGCSLLPWPVVSGS